MEIKLRTKTTKNISPEGCRKLEGLIQDFIGNIAKTQFLDMLWQLTVDPEKQMQELGFSTDFDKSLIIRNELLSQWQQFYKDTPSAFDAQFTEYQDNYSFRKMKEYVKDRVALWVIINQCELCREYRDIGDFAYTVNCLKSYKEEAHYKGLRRLHFDREEEQKFLINSVKSISFFLKSLNEEEYEKYERERIQLWYPKVNDSGVTDNKELPFTLGEEESEISDNKNETVYETSIDKIMLVSQKEQIQALFRQYYFFEEAKASFEKAKASLKNSQLLLENREKIEEIYKLLEQF